MITLALFARWGRFSSERDFYRYAGARLRDAFPTLPDRSFNRLVRSTWASWRLSSRTWRPFRRTTKVSLRSTGQLRDAHRDAKRRGHGWLAGCADIGWSNSLGWYEGFRLLTAVDPTGVICRLQQPLR